MQSIDTLKINKRYIDPKVDWSFKRIFGTDANRELLIAFLNEVFKGKKYIIDLVYNKNEHQGNNEEEAKAIFDVLCTGDNGERFLIEVQNSTAVNFKKRAIYYTSRLISEQALKGETVTWKYNITEVYLVAILETESEISFDTNRYLHDIVLCYRDTGELFYDGLGYIFLDLINFTKTEEESTSNLDKWLYWLKHLPEAKELPLNLKETVFEKLFELAEYNNLTPEEQAMYDQNQKIRWDNAAADAWTVRKVELRYERETKERILEIAKKAKGKNIPLSDIVDLTGLSIVEIEKL